MSSLPRILTAPSSWFWAIIIVQNLLIIGLYKHWGRYADLISRRLIICIALLIALFVLTLAAFVFFSRDTYRESKVDVSPIAELNSEDIARMPEVLEQLRENGTLTQYRVQENPGAWQLNEKHSFSFRWEYDTSLMVSVSFFETEQGAIAILPSDAVYRDSPDMVVRRDSGRSTFICFDNGTEAGLSDSHMIEYPGSLWFPNTQRQINTSIRLENYRITMSEFQHYLDLDNPISSEFIKMLCEMLKCQD